MRHIQIAIAFAVVLLGTLISPAFAQQATPERPEIPQQTAPLGVATVTLPEDGPAIVALFKEVMKTGEESRFAGMTVEEDRIRLTIGNPVAGVGPSQMLQAVNLPAGDFFPADFTAADYIALAAKTKDTGTVAYGQDGAVVWLVAGTTAGIAAIPRPPRKYSAPVHHDMGICRFPVALYRLGRQPGRADRAGDRLRQRRPGKCPRPRHRSRHRRPRTTGNLPSRPVV